MIEQNLFLASHELTAKANNGRGQICLQFHRSGGVITPIIDISIQFTDQIIFTIWFTSEFSGNEKHQLNFSFFHFRLFTFLNIYLCRVPFVTERKKVFHDNFLFSSFVCYFTGTTFLHKFSLVLRRPRRRKEVHSNSLPFLFFLCLYFHINR